MLWKSRSVTWQGQGSYGLLETKVKESVETATVKDADAKVKKVAVKKKGSLHADRVKSV